MLLVIDLIGTFVFAVEGALAGINAGLDVFGLLVLSFVTALGGGTIRDLLIGAIPPNSIRDWRYGATAFAGGGAVFFFDPLFQRVPMHLMITLDAAGLALFAVAGVGKALEYGITSAAGDHDGCSDRSRGRDGAGCASGAGAWGVALGCVCCGGAGWCGWWWSVGLKLKMPRGAAMSFGAAACFVLRMVAAWQHWNLPKVMGH